MIYVLNHSNFNNDLKVYHTIKSPSDCSLLQSDTDCVHDRFLANFTKLNLRKIRVIPFKRKMNILNYQYTLGNFLIVRSVCITGLGVCTNCEHYFHHAEFLCSRVTNC
jgi:hypothetical protein